MAVFDDLSAEQARLEGILAGLDDPAWRAPSAAAGWTVADVVLHLAQTEEAVAATVAGVDLRAGAPASASVDDLMDQLVRAERAEPAAVFRRWQEARQGAVSALRGADPQQPLSWVDAPLKPVTLATTRLAEHWAHGLDITAPLGIAFPDTDRLRHVAWLAHRMLPYALALAGRGETRVHCDLAAPDGETRWQFGPADADTVITGQAGEFFRVAARRLAPGDFSLRATGPHGAAALQVLRTYAT